MAVRIQLVGTGLAKVRFAISPLFETVMALDSFTAPGAVHLPWVRWAQPLLASIPDLSLVLNLLTPGVKPDYLMPIPDDRLPDLNAELAVLRAEAPRDASRIASVLLRAHEVLLAPHWKRIVAVLEADVAYRARVLADGGIEAVFAELHGEISWVDGELVLYPGRRTDSPVTVDPGPHGIVLSPSVFTWPKVCVARDPVAAGVVRYPARGIGTLWEHTAPPPDGLAALVGRTRARLLVLLNAPTTTSDLASRLGVTPGAVSQHLGVLRGAGLVNSHRDGRTLLHLRTARADALLA